jgi:hypothetical protein
MIQVIVLMKLYLLYDREVQIQDVNLQRKILELN